MNNLEPLKVTVDLKSVKVNGLDCPEYSLEVRPKIGVIVSCATCDTAVVTAIPGAPQACYFIVAKCKKDGCQVCIKVEEHCLCGNGVGCPGCQTCNPTTLECESNCKPGQLCKDGNDCVDCKADTDCPCDQKCNGNGGCYCPPDKPFKGPDGCCRQCQVDTDCGSCAICTTSGACQAKDCPNGKCDPTINDCVDCLINNDCKWRGPNWCCSVGKKCECCPGYEFNPALNDCVKKPPCQTDVDCKLPCEECTPEGCKPKVCAPDEICIPGAGGCVKKCECGSGPCNSHSACVKDQQSGACYCKECSGSCSGNADCGADGGCICDITGTFQCVVNPCGGSCNTGTDCGPGCGCGPNKTCVPCNTLSCDICGSYSGCGCPTGTCEDIKDKCNPANAGLSWTKDCPSSNGSSGDTSKLTGSVEVVVNGQNVKNPDKGGLYEAVQFLFTVDQQVTGTWSYSPDASTVKTLAATGNTLSLFNTAEPVSDNLFGFKVIFEASDGRKITFNVYNLSPVPQDTDWQAEVASSYAAPSSTSSQPCSYKLCVTDPNFKIKGWNPTDEIFTESEGKKISIIVKEVTDTCITLDLSGCGTYRGKLPLECFGQTVYADIPLFNNNQCCDLRRATCDGGEGQCEQVTKTIKLIAKPLFGGDNEKNDFLLVPDLNNSGVDFEDLYHLSGKPFYGKEANGTNNDLDLSSSIGIDTGIPASPLYKVISFRAGGCANFKGAANCTTIVGQLCFEECTEFAAYVKKNAEGMYTVYTSSPEGPPSNLTIAPNGDAGGRVVSMTKIPGSENWKVVVDVNKQATNSIILNLTQGNCSTQVTIDASANKCALSAYELYDPVTESIRILVSGGSGDYLLSYVLTTDVGVPGVKTETSAGVPVGIDSGAIQFIVPSVKEFYKLEYSVTDKETLCQFPGEEFGTQSFEVEQCFLGLEVSANGAECSIDATGDNQLCPCTQNANMQARLSSIYATLLSNGKAQVMITTDITPIIQTLPIGGNVQSYKLDVGSVSKQSGTGSVTESRSTVSVTGPSVTISYEFTPPSPGLSATITLKGTELKLDNGCVYDANIIKLEFMRVLDTISVQGEQLEYYGQWLSRTANGEKPEFLFTRDGVLLKRVYGELSGNKYRAQLKKTDGTASNPALRPNDFIQVQLECGCTELVGLSGYCMVPKPVVNTDSLVCTPDGKMDVYVNVDACFPYAKMTFQLQTSAGVNIADGLAFALADADSQGNVSSVKLTGTLSMSSGYKVVVSYFGDPSCNASVTFQTPALYQPTPEYTCPGTSGAGFYDVTIPGATMLYDVNSLETFLSDTLIDEVDASSRTLIAYDERNCPSPEFAISRTCACTLINFQVPAPASVCETASAVLISINDNPDSNTDYEYSFDDVTYTAFTGGQVDAVDALPGTPGALTVGTQTITVYLREILTPACLVQQDVRIVVTEAYTITNVAQSCGAGDNEVVVTFESNANLNEINVNGFAVTNTGNPNEYQATVVALVGSTITISAGSGAYIAQSPIVANDCSQCLTSDLPFYSNLSVDHPCEGSNETGFVTFTKNHGSTCGGSGAINVTAPVGWTFSNGGYVIPANAQGSYQFSLLDTNCGCTNTFNVNVEQQCGTCDFGLIVSIGCNGVSAHIVNGSVNFPYTIEISKSGGGTETQVVTTNNDTVSLSEGAGTYSVTAVSNTNPNCHKEYYNLEVENPTATIGALNTGTGTVPITKSGTCSAGWYYNKGVATSCVIPVSGVQPLGNEIAITPCRQNNLFIYCGDCLVAQQCVNGSALVPTNQPTTGSGTITPGDCTFTAKSANYSSSPIKGGTFLIRTGATILKSLVKSDCFAGYVELTPNAGWINPGETKAVEFVWTPTGGGPEVILQSSSITCSQCVPLSITSSPQFAALAYTTIGIHFSTNGASIPAYQQSTIEVYGMELGPGSCGTTGGSLQSTGPNGGVITSLGGNNYNLALTIPAGALMNGYIKGKAIAVRNIKLSDGCGGVIDIGGITIDLPSLANMPSFSLFTTGVVFDYNFTSIPYPVSAGVTGSLVSYSNFSTVFGSNSASKNPNTNGTSGQKNFSHNGTGGAAFIVSATVAGGSSFNALFGTICLNTGS